jgi:hypothetical protein
MNRSNSRSSRARVVKSTSGSTPGGMARSRRRAMASLNGAAAGAMRAGAPAVAGAVVLLFGLML